MWLALSIALQLAVGGFCLEPKGPILTHEPRNHVDFSNTTGKRVDCVASGSPPPITEWIRSDGSRVTNVPGLRQVLSNGSLHFPPFRAEDYRQDVHATTYRCLASNVLGAVVSREIKVRAVVNQYYEVQVYDEFVIQGNTAVLKCHIPSFVHDYITVTSWIRESGGEQQTVVENGNRYSIVANGVLHIRDVVPSDDRSSYRCQTQHLLTGEKKLSTSAGRLVITEPKSSVPPRITHSRSHVEGQRGQRAELPCAAQGYPLPSYSWHRMKEAVLIALPLNDRVRQLSGTLILHDLVQEDTATYVCFVNNSVGFERIETTLTVIAPLSASIRPGVQVIDEGKPASFSCTVSGFPVAFISWIKDGKHLVMNERVRLESREVLHIESVRREDRGMFQCLARNDHSSSQAAAELKLGDAPPVFSHTFPEQTLQPGRLVSLRCAASGSPTPQIVWTLDDVSVPVMDRIQLVEYVSLRGDIISYVNISKVMTEDGGEYRCVAKNSVGKVEHVARLNIYGPPFVRPMKNVSAVSGSDMVLRCRIAGHPIDIIRWERGGSVLPINHRQNVYPNGTLVVRDVQRALDAGPYTCVVANNQDITSRRTVHVSVLNAPIINPFSFPNNLREGLRAGIQCLVIEGDQPVTITWLKDEKPIAAHLGVITRNIDDLTSSLVINNITPRHTGNYTCVAKNTVATVRFTASLLVNVPPRWVVEPKDSSVILHESLRLDCQVDGSPLPSITWKKAMGKVPAEYKLVRQLGLNALMAENGSLLVASAREGHEGHYVCQASNGVGAELSKVIFVDVHVPAYFESKVRNQTATKGSSVSLVCDVRGDLPINVVWKYKGNKIDPSTDHRFTVQERAAPGGLISELIISRVDRRDNGQYGCQATNAFGRDESKIQVYVKEPPEAPKRLKPLETGSRFVKLSWTPSYDGNNPVIKFIIQFKTDSETWHPRGQNLTVSGRETRAEVDGLRPAVTYQLRVQAENSIGVSEPSSAITITTNEEAPSGPPQDVQVDSTTSRSLRIRWKAPKRDHWNGALRGYHIGYRDHGAGGQFLFVTADHRQGEETFEHVLTDLNKFTQYGVTVEAFNRVGNGPSSVEVIAFTLEDVPSEPPRNVQCTTLSSRSIHVKWLAPVMSAIHGVLQGYRISYVAFDSPTEEKKAVTTSQLQTDLHELHKFSNYSIKVAAYNRAGEGTPSHPVYCITDEDVPGPPAEIKALVMSSDAIIVSWKAPELPNGVLNKYNIYIRELSGSDNRPIMYSLPPGQTHYEVRGLKEDSHYEFWVTASTSVGEGESTRVVSQSPISTVPARIASFSEQFLMTRKEDVKLPCRAVGIPTPDREWKLRGQKVHEGTRVAIVSDGSLSIVNVRHSDAGNYTCHVYNIYAKDEVTHELIVKGPPMQEAPPTAPELNVVFRTATSITVNWKVDDDGGDTILGYTLYSKKEGHDWEEVLVEPNVDSYTLTNLHCGSRYHLYMLANNKIGSSGPSETKMANTKGFRPEIPDRDRFLDFNSTHVALELSTWLDGGCPIHYFVVEYKQKDEVDWLVASKDIEQKKGPFIIKELLPGTWYNVRVTAFNDAGPSSVEYDFPTDKAQPDLSLERNSSRISEIFNLHIILPFISIGCVILLSIGVVCLVFQCRRARDLKHNVGVRTNSRMPVGTADFSKRLAGNSSPAFTQLPSSSSARKLNSTGNSPFGHPHYDETGSHDDICPYATSQVSTCLVDDPASMQLKTFAHGAYKVDHVTPQRSEQPAVNLHGSSKAIYAKPVKLITSTDDNFKFQKNSSPPHSPDGKTSPITSAPAHTWIPSPSASQENLVLQTPCCPASLKPSAPPAENESSLSESDNPDVGYRRSRAYSNHSKRSSSGFRHKPFNRVPDLLYHGPESCSSSEESPPLDRRDSPACNDRVKGQPAGKVPHRSTYRQRKRSCSPESSPEEAPHFSIQGFLGVPPGFSDPCNTHNSVHKHESPEETLPNQELHDSGRCTSLKLAAEEEELIALLRRDPMAKIAKKSELDEIISRT